MKKVLIAGVVCLVLAAGWYFLDRRSDPSNVARHIAESLALHRFGDLWRYSPDQEREANAWSEKEFVALASAIGRRVSQDVIGVTELSAGTAGEPEQIAKSVIRTAQPMWDTRNERHFEVELAAKEAPPIRLILRRDKSGEWKTIVVDLLIQINRSAHFDDPKQRWRILRDALQASGSESITSISSGQVWTVEQFNIAIESGVMPIN